MASLTQITNPLSLSLFAYEMEIMLPSLQGYCEILVNEFMHMVPLYDILSVNGSVLFPLNDFTLYLIAKSKHKEKEERHVCQCNEI